MPDNGEITNLPVPVMVRTVRSRSGAALWILAWFAIVAAMYLGRSFFVPLLVGILGSYTLHPVVDWLTSRCIPRALAAAIVMAVLTGLLSWTAYSTSDDVAAMAEKLPDFARRLHASINKGGNATPTTLQNVQEAARELEKAAATATGEKVAVRAVPVAVAPPPSSFLRDYLVLETTMLAGVAAKIPLVLLLMYFLLAAGNQFRRKLVRIVGQSLSQKKDIVAILEEVEVQVQRYMLAMLVANILIALCTWAVFAALGVENAGVWGIAAGILHFIPYLGPLLISIASGVAAFLQFGTVMEAVMVAGAAGLVAAGIGTIFMTWLLSRFARVNSAMLFIALLFFGSLWGVAGVLLGAPLVAIAKVICDRVELFKPVGELLGH